MTTEYTPTTAEVDEYFAIRRERGVEGWYAPEDQDRARKEWDLMLAAHDARVRAEAEATAALITIRDHARAVLAVSDRDTRIGTHYEDCHLHHRDCLAAWAARTAETALDEMGVPR